MTSVEEFDRLIKLGREVLATRRPPPEFVIGSDRIDSALFGEWRSGSLALFDRVFGPLSSFAIDFRLLSSTPHPQVVEQGVGILRAARQECEATAAGGNDERFVSSDSTHDAYLLIREILQTAKKSVDVVDPYLDESILRLIGRTDATSLTVRLLSWKIPSDFQTELARFTKQYPHISIEVRRSRKFHDRFMILDGSVCYHVGASLKDAGSRAFMISRLRDSENVKALTAEQKRAWSEATEVTTAT